MKDAKPKLMVKALKNMGFIENGGSKHLKMTKEVEGKTVTVMVQTHGVIKRNTVEAIRKNAGIDKKTFYSHNF
jgi:predicted RNA binding protein YcfA (HicA-like mRNA interferase family)